jgi:serine protease inhibitor
LVRKEDNTTQAEMEEHSQSVEDGQREFAARLAEQVFNKAGTNNAFLSPFSASVGLTLTWAGAKDQTAEQMASALHLPKDLTQGSPSGFHRAFLNYLKGVEEGQGEVIFRMGNALWVDVTKPLVDSYVEQVDPYKVVARNVDFVNEREAARQTINTWVEEQTEHKITNLIPPGALTNLTRLVITNAIYFKGLWEIPFDREQTNPSAAFHLLGNSGQVQVPMMHLRDTEFFYKDESDHVVVGLPYKGNQTAMFILLPKQNTVEALHKLSSKDQLLAFTSQVSQIRKNKITLSLPRFKTTYNTSLKEMLINLGMALPFSDQANFGGLTPEGDLQIDDVLHKAFVEVNEEGTEAAAATAVIMALRGLARPNPVVTVDHPFVFVIMHLQSQSVLFTGRITNPLQES